MKNFLKKLKELFPHRHKWEYYGEYTQRYNRLTCTPYSTRYFKCSSCGKIKSEHELYKKIKK